MVEILERPLRVKADISLSPQQLSMLNAIEKYDMWFVAERLQRNGVIPSDFVEPVITEFKKYIALIGLGYHGIGMVSPEIDEVWHNFILFTHEYSEFCLSTVGQFIHHIPETSCTPVLTYSGESFISVYRQVFGEIPPIWYINEHAGEKSNAPSSTTECRSCHSCGGRIDSDVLVSTLKMECKSNDDQPPPTLCGGNCQGK